MLSYSHLRSHPKVTLPSVDHGWMRNTNIIKDPPKSITTRRIDKVDSTQIIVDMEEDNGSRICGNILKFPRGVNPAAEYTEPLPHNGVGSNSTIRDNSNNPPTFRSDPGYGFHSQFTRGSGGYLSRRLMMYHGAFRPPIYTQEQLLPLSRQPRIRTSCVTHPEMISYAERPCDIDMGKTLKEYVLQPQIDPSVKYTIEESNQVHRTGDFIQDVILNKNVSSGMRTRDLTLQENQKCLGVTRIDPTTAYAYTQPCSDKITRDTMLYVMENPGMNYVRNDLLRGQVLPNASYMDKEGDTRLDKTNYILEYPRAVRDVVCPVSDVNGVKTTQPAIKADFFLKENYTNPSNVVANPIRNYIQSADNQDKTSYFIKDDALNVYDVVNAPRLNNVVARNIIDGNTLDTQKFVRDDVLYSYDVDAGYGGSNCVAKNLDDTADMSQVKLCYDTLHADAVSQKLGTCSRTNYVHTNKSGKRKALRQFQQEAPRTTAIADEYTITQRGARLPYKLSVNDSVDNVGYRPQTSDKYVPVNVVNKDDGMRDRLRRVRFARDEKIEYE